MRIWKSGVRIGTSGDKVKRESEETIRKWSEEKIER